jgi:Zn finger protein HypA/HybF involved in hydrogenase expression
MIELKVECSNCGYIIDEFSNVFEGKNPSYICPLCRYEGYVKEKEQIMMLNDEWGKGEKI